MKKWALIMPIAVDTYFITEFAMQFFDNYLVTSSVFQYKNYY